MMMTPRMMILLAGLAAIPAAALAQPAIESGLPTQTLVRPDSKSVNTLTLAAVSLQVDGKNAPLTSLTPLRPGAAQVALLIDDGLSRSAGIQLNDLKAFLGRQTCAGCSGCCVTVHLEELNSLRI